MNIFGYIRESINEGEGLRSVIFISGCHGLCEGCHNPESWDFSFGVPFSKSLQLKIKEEVVNNPLLDGVTFCGGEPFLSARELVPFVKHLKQCRPELSFWSYTGFAFEDLMKNRDQYELLSQLDVLIDGRFIQKQKDLTLKWRGSSNQRIIDVQKTLDKQQIILYDE